MVQPTSRPSRIFSLRNNAQAEAFGFFATPSFIVGTFRVPNVLELASFRQAIKDARALQKKSKEK